MRYQVLPYGDRAWLIDCAADAFAVAESLRRYPWPHRPEVVVGARTCLLRFPVAAPEQQQVEQALAGTAAEHLNRPNAWETMEIAVRYDGADLAAVAEQAGCSVQRVIALHTAAVHRVAFLGFAPGFAYLHGLPEPLRVPRRSVPRVSVPPGSLAIADQYSAIYPRASPGGWHLIGTTDLVLFDPVLHPASRLRPGMLVTFRAVR